MRDAYAVGGTRTDRSARGVRTILSFDRAINILLLLFSGRIREVAPSDASSGVYGAGPGHALGPLGTIFGTAQYGSTPIGQITLVSRSG